MELANFFFQQGSHTWHKIQIKKLLKQVHRFCFWRVSNASCYKRGERREREREITRKRNRELPSFKWVKVIKMPIVSKIKLTFNCPRFNFYLLTDVHLTLVYSKKKKKKGGVEFVKTFFPQNWNDFERFSKNVYLSFFFFPKTFGINMQTWYQFIRASHKKWRMKILKINIWETEKKT